MGSGPNSVSLEEVIEFAKVVPASRLWKMDEGREELKGILPLSPFL